MGGAIGGPWWVLAVGVLLQAGPGHLYQFKTGQCQSIAPTVSDFSLQKFLGKWYVIQGTNVASRCYSLTLSESTTSPGSFSLAVDKQLFSLRAAGVVHKFRYEAQIFPNPENPASMVLRLPSQVYNDVSHEVVGTDYTNWAVMWSCTPIMFGHLESGLILSRTATLPLDNLIDIRTTLQGLGMDLWELSTVQQGDCNPKLGGGFFTLELAPTLSNTAVDWDVLIPVEDLPALSTTGCFVQEGDFYLYFEVCPPGSQNVIFQPSEEGNDDSIPRVPGSTTTTSGGSETTSGGTDGGEDLEYYYYYTDEGEDEAITSPLENVDVVDTKVEISDEDLEDNLSDDDEYYYYYDYYEDEEYDDEENDAKIEENSSSDKEKDKENDDNENNDSNSRRGNEDTNDNEDGDEYDYYEYYDDEYYDDEYYDNDDEYYDGDDEYYYDDIYYDDDDDGYNEEDTEKDTTKSVLPSSSRVRRADDDEVDIEREGPTATRITRDARHNVIKTSPPTNVHEAPGKVVEKMEKFKQMGKTEEKQENLIKDTGIIRKIIWTTRNIYKKKRREKRDLKLEKKDTKIKLGSGKDSEKRKGGEKKDNKKNDVKKDARKNTQGEKNNAKKTTEVMTKNNKKGETKKNEAKMKRMIDNKMKMKTKTRKKTRSRRKNQNPVVAKLIMVSAPLQRFLLQHNVRVKRLPVKLRYTDLSAFFSDPDEQRQLQRLVRGAGRKWKVVQRMKTLKKNGKKNVKLIKRKRRRRKGRPVMMKTQRQKTKKMGKVNNRGKLRRMKKMGNNNNPRKKMRTRRKQTEGTKKGRRKRRRNRKIKNNNSKDLNKRNMRQRRKGKRHRVNKKRMEIRKRKTQKNELNEKDGKSKKDKGKLKKGEEKRKKINKVKEEKESEKKGGNIENRQLKKVKREERIETKKEKRKERRERKEKKQEKRDEQRERKEKKKEKTEERKEKKE
ncbi:Apolipoprotein D-like 8 [Homarus americanus]|uniref:Apolipoprotein D-like 8 n=1 Tax=Homarus americanus TaxID=6706 RepID=A0A8J5JFR5_HOMAM|nr:Apolipoprotein D-like 8 [Homarus americanus]